jgi:hypothetical protein
LWSDGHATKVLMELFRTAAGWSSSVSFSIAISRRPCLTLLDLHHKFNDDIGAAAWGTHADRAQKVMPCPQLGRGMASHAAPHPLTFIPRGFRLLQGFKICRGDGTNRGRRGRKQHRPLPLLLPLLLLLLGSAAAGPTWPRSAESARARRVRAVERGGHSVCCPVLLLLLLLLLLLPLLLLLLLTLPPLLPPLLLLPPPPLLLLGALGALPPSHDNHHHHPITTATATANAAAAAAAAAADATTTTTAISVQLWIQSRWLCGGAGCCCGEFKSEPL